MIQVFTSVTVVCHEYYRLAAMPGATSLIDVFVDQASTQWTLESASQAGYVRLLDRLGEREWSGVSLHFREERLDHAIDEAVRVDEKVPVLEWWVTKYWPESQASPAVDIFKLAVQYNRLHVLEWLKMQHMLRFVDRTERVACISAAVAYFLHKNLPGIDMAITLVRCSNKEAFEFAKWAIANESLYEVAERCHPQMMTDIVLNERFETADWLLKTYPSGYFDDPALAWYGSLDLKTHKWLAFEYPWRDCNKRIAWIQLSIDLAAGRGNLELLGFYLDIQTGADCYQVMQSAVDRGDMRMVRLLFPRQTPVSVFCLNAAAIQGHLGMMQWLYDRGVPLRCTTDTMDRAAALNRLDVVQWLHANRSEGCTTAAMNWAAGEGYLEMVQWLHKHRSEGCTTGAMNAAAHGGHLHVVEWLHANRSEGCTTWAMDGAAEMGHLNVVQWLHEHRSEGCTRGALFRAAEAGELKMVECLHENRHEGCYEGTINCVASCGDLGMLLFFHERRHDRCTTEGLDSAAWNGHLKVVAWIHENNPEVEVLEGLHLAAIDAGSLAMVKYLMMNYNCPVDTHLLRRITGRVHFAALEWLLMYCTSVEYCH